MKSGLLSLNIHDSLTFDGSELCLHPDLFAPPPDGGGGGGGGGGSRKSNDVDTSAVVGGGGGGGGKGSGGGGATTAASTTSATTTTASNQSAAPHGLAVGDMIEIRVWDPLSKDQALLKSPGGGGASPSSTFARKTVPRASPPTAFTSTTRVQVEFPTPTSAATTTGAPSSASKMPFASAGTMNPSVNLRPRTDSLVYSEADQSDDGNDASTVASSDGNKGGGGGGDPSVTNESAYSARSAEEGLDYPPTKTVAMPSTLPPVFPRARAHTTDNHTILAAAAANNATSTTASTSTSTSTKPNGPLLAKPTMLHRRAPSAAGVLPSQPLHQSPKHLHRHTRQISDMTTDTAAHPLDIIDSIQHTDSHDEDASVADHGVGGGVFVGDAWSKVSTTHKLRLSFVLLVTEKTLTCIKGNARTQVSMLRQVADMYSLSSYDTVTVHKIDPQEEEEVLKAVSADFVVVTIKDQFISRGDMQIFQQALQGSWIYEGQRLTEHTRQLKAHAREIRHGNYVAKSGIVTGKTMITFRSRSARIIWLVQLSSEMWDYASPYKHRGQPESICETYFDQWIRFLYKLFKKWKELEVTHSLTVVFFSRTFIGNGQKSTLNCRDVYGRAYEDHYKPVIEDETCTDWETLVVRIKEEFIKFPLEVGWNLTDRRPSSASQGNVLEAVNVTLNIMQFHFLDRDLHRTGNSIVVVSPGCGVFEVDKGLAGITYQRMMDNGIGSDMLSLGLPPLHIAPFFLYNNEFKTVETRGVDTSETYYEVPHWMHLSFISYDREEHQLGDHIHPEDILSSAVKLDGLDSFQVGPNGFVRPKSSANGWKDEEPGGAVFKPKSLSSTFSALGNKAATPRKAKSQQERQLISGRDFRDILEACRPRVSGARLPSPLASILKLNKYAADAERARMAGVVWEPRREVPNTFGSYVPLREWGTVDFTEFPSIRPKQKAFRSESPNVWRSQNDLGNDRVEGSESGSNSSSFASHVSSMFGMSYDRVLWDHYESPLTSKATLQIQRSPSLEFDVPKLKLLTDGESAGFDDSISIVTDNASRSSVGQTSGSGMEDWNQDNETAASQQSKHEKHAESLRKLMDAHDDQVWRPINKSVVAMGEINVIRPESLQHVESEVTIASVKRGPGASGGLGAALSQYSSAVVNEDSPSTGLTRRASGSFLPSSQARNASKNDWNRSQSPVFPNMTQFHERSARAMSPMLIPPIFSLPGQQIKSTNPPPTNSRSEKETVSILHRPQHVDSGSSLSRKGVGSLGLFSSSNYEYGGYQNPMASLTNGDGSRPLIRPVARSPPNSGLLHQVARSPPTTGTGRSAAHGLIGNSPPHGGFQNERVTKRFVNKDIHDSSPPSASTIRQRPNRTLSPTNKSGHMNRPKESSNRNGHTTSQRQSMRRQKACNPFRQSDEDEVLAKRSHNRRRWSHVFPVGDVEFKRHSGPIWNSLTTPAILPLSVDYFPSPQELRDERTFQFNPYTVTLSGIENKHYSSHADLLLEMVRQRVTQDFQIVTDAAVKDSESRLEPQRKAIDYDFAGRNKNKQRVTTSRRGSFVPSLPTIKHDSLGTIKHYLSMGHRIQVLSYDPSSDTIEIVHYNRKSAQNDPLNIYNYRFMMYSRVAEGYAQSMQTFKKYAEPYKWNRVDNLICGEEDHQLEVGMRFRRVTFGLIPTLFKDPSSEQEYVVKFRRLLEYLGKLREKEVVDSSLNVAIVSSADTEQKKVVDIFKVRRPTEENMIKFTVPLRKGKRDPFEWMEIAVDAIFDTSTSYRVMFNWLVASSAKVDTQVQLLHRRCSQFGLHLINFPQTTISRDLFFHAFAVPTIFCLRDKAKSDRLDDELRTRDFVDDGIRFSNAQILNCVDDSDEFDFPKYRNGKMKGIPSHQYVHRTGALFIRNIRDRQGWSILVGIENYRHVSEENGFRGTALEILREISTLVALLSSEASEIPLNG